MGLKTTNYVSKSTGLVLPNAYAQIKDLVLSGNRARVIFSIQASREAIKEYVPIDKVEVHFTWDRKTDLAKAAYDAAKTEMREVETFIAESKEPVIIQKHGTLYGWEDDIVE